MTNPKTMSVNLGPGLVTFYHIRARKWSRPSLTTLEPGTGHQCGRLCQQDMQVTIIYISICQVVLLA